MAVTMQFNYWPLAVCDQFNYRLLTAALAS